MERAETRVPKIAVIGTGYVGLVTGACLADFGLEVTCVDTVAEKIESLKAMRIPIYEPGLDLVVERNAKTMRLSFTTDGAAAVSASDVVFIAVGTPPAEDGSADLSYVEGAARQIARAMNGYKVIVDKSTVPVGTARRVKSWIGEELSKRGVSCEFDVVSNPEFLREGSAVHDFTHPDRVVIGYESERALSMMKQVYRVLYLTETPFIETTLESAELIKYASNAFLAVKITFMNEIADLCEKLGANVKDVGKAVGKDGRIGPKFLHPGPGYGGSCFPKDTRALAHTGREYGFTMSIVEAAIEANERQKSLMAEKIAKELGELKGTRIAVLGLAFKPNTDDMREAPALAIIEALVKAGASCSVYDPAAMKEARWRLKPLGGSVHFFENEYETMEGADALVIVTEWNQFRNMDLNRVKTLLKRPFFFDLRNIYDKGYVEAFGLSYIGVGA